MQLAGLLAFPPLKRPSHPRVDSGEVVSKFCPPEAEQDYSYGDSAGFAPASLFIRLSAETNYGGKCKGLL